MKAIAFAIRALMAAGALTAALAASAAHAGSVNVTTYHYDNERTGWNQVEGTLNWSTVGSSQFGLLKTVVLDEQVDAQALVVSVSAFTHLGVKKYRHDLVYVATENNSIYAVDSVTGAVEIHVNLGTPVPYHSLPGSCNNNSSVIGITGTPVIDLPKGVMYAIAATWENAAIVYRIHELSVATLAEVVPPVVISASQTLSDGTLLPFNPTGQRQRTALLLSQGVIYAGFGSFCDFAANISRGWLMGWTAGTLQPLPNVELVNHQTVAQAGNFLNGSFFLSSIWMSGFGPAADKGGYIYVQTGNSNAQRVDNFQDTALKFAPGLTSIVDFFTPSNYQMLDDKDLDLGSGGVVVVPGTPGFPLFAVGGGKDGRLFLFNREKMGGLSTNGVDAAPSVNQGQCWCGPSFFVGSDGQLRIVSSGGLNVNTWILPKKLGSPLAHEAKAATFATSTQDPGFMTSVSSNGTSPGTAIVWAQTRATPSATVSLYAFAASPGLPTLYSGISGAWPNLGGNSNIVPVVANGRVFIPSYKELEIFGLAAAGSSAAAAPVESVASNISGPEYFGEIVGLDASGEKFTLALRSGLNIEVDATRAVTNHESVVLYSRETVEVKGVQPPDGPFSATAILRAKENRASWGPDVP